MMLQGKPKAYPDESFAMPPQHALANTNRSWETFIDSDIALGIATSNLHVRHRNEGSNYIIQMNLESAQTDASVQDEEWRIFLHDQGPAREHDNVVLSARSGEVLRRLT